MKSLIYFKLKNCPYCKRADKLLSELLEENPEYRKIEIKIVDESSESKLANSYDYYYVPAFFSEDKKLHEGVADKEKIVAVLDYALEKINV